ncbi:hypothetical protein [Methylocapsa acidiphila]|uniref:hypothetical protein n=1 Tax=Methylocapsa acidiphila TaxID=133552 RepID=UPI00041C750C|nr:hypothetical protein [Methylocapsa acidiphila]
MKFRKLAMTSAAVLAVNALASAYGHETRVLPATFALGKNIRLTVGFHVEPAFEDSFNAVDVILYTYDGACADPSDFWGQVIDVSGTSTNADPDSVSLTVDALYLKNQTQPTGAGGSVAPVGIVKTLTITNASALKEAYGDAGTYNSWFRPTHEGNSTAGGAYGFHVKGTVHAGANSYQCSGDSAPHALAARTVNIDAYYVCGNGSLNPPHSFNCVAAIQPFPGRAEDGYQASGSLGSGRHW